MTSPDSTTPPPADALKQTRGNSFRGKHRRLSDEAAHDNGQAFTPPPILEHPLVCAASPEIIDTPHKLSQAVAHLRDAGTFGYDTEFIGEDSYYPHLCLIQAATPQRVLLIDPLAINDLAIWWELLTDPSLTKIVHAGAQDIEPVMRLTGKPAANLFDTQVSSAFAGHDYPLSLGNTIHAILGVEHDAGAKFSQWQRRPLTPQQIHYAAGDVRYLCAIHAFLRDKLDTLSNTHYAHQACVEWCNPERYITNPLTRKIKAKGVHKLSRKKRAVFNALLTWREQAALQRNVTPRGLISDEAVYEIANALPLQPEHIGNIKFVPRPLAMELGDSLMDTINAAIDGPYPPKHRPPQYDRNEHRNLANALWDRIAKHCEAQQIAPAVVTSKRELGPLLIAAMLGKDLPKLQVTEGWRRQLLGEIIEPDALILNR